MYLDLCYAVIDISWIARYLFGIARYLFGIVFPLHQSLNFTNFKDNVLEKYTKSSDVHVLYSSCLSI